MIEQVVILVSKTNRGNRILQVHTTIWCTEGGPGNKNKSKQKTNNNINTTW